MGGGTTKAVCPLSDTTFGGLMVGVRAERGWGDGSV